jgi:hypothetical protein
MHEGDARSPFLCRRVLRNGDFKQVPSSRAMARLDLGSIRTAANRESKMQLSHRLIASVLIASATTAVQAATPASPAVPLASCVDLSPNHEAFRFGSQYLLVQDGDARYRLSFGGDCDALLQSAQFDISTDGKSNRLCANGSKVRTRSACPVSSVVQIDADQFARYRRRSR